MEPATEVASTLGSVIVIIYMVVVVYVAYLKVSDSHKRWEKRYGDRWFVTPSEKKRLDKEYETAQKAKRAEDSEDDDDGEDDV